MGALFGRKICDLEELRELTIQANQEGRKGQPYTVIREVILDDEDFKKFSSDFLENQLWISPKDGGVNHDGEIRCIRVINSSTGEKVLVNSEGYDYARYTGLEL